MNVKSLPAAIGMAVALFVYGYIFSAVGHDHSSHGPDANTEMKEGHVHNEHNHAHH